MNKGKKKIAAIRIFRTISQILLFVFLPALFINVFSGVKQVYLSIAQQNFDFSALLPQIIETAVIIPVTFFAGRFFCGWMCAFGAMGDFIYYISSKIYKHKFKINEKTDRLLKLTKYLILAFILLAVWPFSYKIFGNANPWDAFGMLFTVGRISAFSYAVTTMLPALIILGAIIVGSIFIERFFCRYLCPLGAVFSILSKLRFLTIKKPKTNCGNCRVCTNNCPMGIALYKADNSKSGECINCFKCVSACPRKNVNLSVLKNNIHPIPTGVIAVVFITGLYFAGNMYARTVETYSASTQSTIKADSNNMNTDTAVVLPASAFAEALDDASAQYKDGTYTGSGTGYRGAVTTVNVEIVGGKISTITSVTTGDDSKFFSRAFPVITQSVITEQSADVDAVSGATFSSSGIIQAVSDALSKAS